MAANWKSIGFLIFSLFVSLVLFDFIVPGLLSKFTALGTVAIAMFTFFLWHLEVERESVEFTLKAAGTRRGVLHFRVVNQGRRASAVEDVYATPLTGTHKGAKFRAETMYLRSVGGEERREGLVVESGDHVWVAIRSWQAGEAPSLRGPLEGAEGEVRMKVEVHPVLGDYVCGTFTISPYRDITFFD